MVGAKNLSPNHTNNNIVLGKYKFYGDFDWFKNEKGERFFAPTMIENFGKEDL